MSKTSFLSNHSHVLLEVYRRPRITLRELAAHTDLTERTVQRIVRELTTEGYLNVTKEGRRNRYEVNLDAPIHQALETHMSIRQLLAACVADVPPAPATKQAWRSGRKLRIATRRSPLAVSQTQVVADLVRRANPTVTCEIVTMDTSGDRLGAKPPRVGGKDLFTRELEAALLAGEVDFAVHSLKDLPIQLPNGLVYVGSPQRGVATDAFISSRWKSFDDVPDDAVIATGSLRRKAQLLSQKPGLRFVNPRGSVDAKLAMLEAGEFDGFIVATSALHRLNRADVLVSELPPETFVPAVSQGAIGIEAREDDADVREIIQSISDADTVEAVSAERTFMRALEGRRRVPLGAHCTRVGGVWAFRGWVGSADGGRVLAETARGTDANLLARQMSRAFLDRGARAILAAE